MRVTPVLLVALPLAAMRAQAQGFGACKPVAERSSELGCWILADQPVGPAPAGEVFWHLDAFPDSARAQRAKGANGVVIQSLGRSWLMTIDASKSRPKAPGEHVADIGPLHVARGTEYSATFLESVMTPGMTSAVHRHPGPEAWYTVSGEVCLEIPDGKIVGGPGKPAIVPQGPPMFLTAIGRAQRRGITLILHETAQPPTTMEKTWKPKGLCK